MSEGRNLNFIEESNVLCALCFYGANQFSFVVTPPTPIIRYLSDMSFFIKTIPFFIDSSKEIWFSHKD